MGSPEGVGRDQLGTWDAIHGETARTNSECLSSASELLSLADGLGAPGSMHTAGWLVDFVRQGLRHLVDQKMLAAAVRAHWDGGKVGFSFLPRPPSLDDDEDAYWEYEDYEYEAADLVEFVRGDDAPWEPRDLMANDKYERDLDFYDSLPERFTVYRGVSGVEPALAAAGVCWTTKRNIAEWFALRGSEPHTVVSARTG